MSDQLSTVRLVSEYETGEEIKANMIEVAVSARSLAKAGALVASESIASHSEIGKEQHEIKAAFDALAERCEALREQVETTRFVVMAAA